MMRRRVVGALRQLMELCAERIEQFQFLCEKLSNVAILSSACTLIHFLQQDQIGIRAGEKLRNFIESVTTGDVPAHNPNPAGRV